VVKVTFAAEPAFVTVLTMLAGEVPVVPIEKVLLVIETGRTAVPAFIDSQL